MRFRLWSKDYYHILQLELFLFERGEAITIMAELSLPDDYQERGVIARPLSPKYQRDIGLAFMPSQKQSPATRAFIQLVEKRINTKLLFKLEGGDISTKQSH